MTKALFLDRDGVINVDYNYVSRSQDFEWVEGIFDLCKAAQDKGYILIVITNQGGIGRGLYTQEDFDELTRWMQGQLKERGIAIAKVYHCPHHPEHGQGEYKLDCEDRKPNPGMILKAAKEFNIDLTQSLLVGDKQTDIEAGKRAGLGTCLLFGPEGDIQALSRVVELL